MSLFLRYMVTTGFDAKLRVWDIRQYKPVNCYSTYRPAPSVDISQRGLVALGHDNHCEVRKMSSSLSLSLSKVDLFSPSDLARCIHKV